MLTVIVTVRAPECLTTFVTPSRTVQASRASMAGGSSMDAGACTWQSIPAAASMWRAAASSAARRGWR